MSVFQNNSSSWQRLDWSILQNGWISLYWRKEWLKEDMEWFLNEKYKITSFDCSTWKDGLKMHEQLKNELNFPDYYGKNFDALNDCLSDLEILEPGQIIVFNQLDKLNDGQIHILLDIFANNARRHMLFGSRLMVLGQVDDPSFETESVGSTPVMWNRREWLNSNRQKN